MELIIKCTNFFPRNKVEETVVVKGVQGHPRVENELAILKRFQDKCSRLRPLVDEIEDPPKPAIIVLKHLDDHLLDSSKQKTLNQKELKYVSRCMHLGSTQSAS